MNIKLYPLQTTQRIHRLHLSTRHGPHRHRPRQRRVHLHRRRRRHRRVQCPACVGTGCDKEVSTGDGGDD